MNALNAKIIPFPVERVALPSLGMVARIQKLVANSYGVPPESMRSKCHRRDEAWPRQVAMYLSRKATGKSFPCIAREFGHRDHSTVMYAIKAVERRMAANPVYLADVEALLGALR